MLIGHGLWCNQVRMMLIISYIPILESLLPPPSEIEFMENSKLLKIEASVYCFPAKLLQEKIESLFDE